MINPKVRPAFSIVFSIFFLMVVGMTSVLAFRSFQPSQPVEPGVAVGIFVKGQKTAFLFEEGLLRRWWICEVQDVKDNWVKCKGGLWEDKKIIEPVDNEWFNTDRILRVKIPSAQ
jgi:hypothetical protein